MPDSRLLLLVQRPECYEIGVKFMIQEFVLNPEREEKKRGARGTCCECSKPLLTSSVPTTLRITKYEACIKPDLKLHEPAINLQRPDLKIDSGIH